MCSNQLSYSGIRSGYPPPRSPGCFTGPGCFTVSECKYIAIFLSRKIIVHFFPEKSIFAENHQLRERMAKQIIILILLTLYGLQSPAQGSLTFDTPRWDFGTIQELDGPVSHTFTGENRGDKPLVILDVVTSCGCTVPRFSKRPILPGEKTEITVTYDPRKPPGSLLQRADGLLQRAEKDRRSHRTKATSHRARKASRSSIRSMPEADCGWPRHSTPSPISMSGSRYRGPSATSTTPTVRSASPCGR